MGLFDSVNEDQFNLLGLFFLLYPLCFVLSKINNPEVKKAFIVVSGGAFVVYFYGLCKYCIIF